jgi:hypothetical protein
LQINGSLKQAGHIDKTDFKPNLEEIKKNHYGLSGICLQSQLLRKWRQKDYKFKANPGKVRKTLSQKQNFKEKAGLSLK